MTLQPGRLMEGMAMVKLWQVGILPRLAVRMALESQMPLAGFETANNYMKFLLQTLVLEQATNSSHTLFFLPLAQALTSLQVTGIPKFYFTCLHAQLPFGLSTQPDPSVCAWGGDQLKTQFSLLGFSVEWCIAPRDLPVPRLECPQLAGSLASLAVVVSQVLPTRVCPSLQSTKPWWEGSLAGTHQGEGGDLPKISCCQLQAGASASCVTETPSMCCAYCVDIWVCTYNYTIEV